MQSYGLPFSWALCRIYRERQSYGLPMQVEIQTPKTMLEISDIELLSFV